MKYIAELPRTKTKKLVSPKKKRNATIASPEINIPAGFFMDGLYFKYFFDKKKPKITTSISVMTEV